MKLLLAILDAELEAAVRRAASELELELFEPALPRELVELLQPPRTPTPLELAHFARFTRGFAYGR